MKMKALMFSEIFFPSWGDGIVLQQYFLLILNSMLLLHLSLVNHQIWGFLIPLLWEERMEYNRFL